MKTQNKLLIWLAIMFLLFLPVLVLVISAAEGAESDILIEYRPPAAVNQLCSMIGPPRDDYLACTIHNLETGTCLIIIPHPDMIGDELYAKILAHELSLNACGEGEDV